MALKAFGDAPVSDAVFLSSAVYPGNTGGDLPKYLSNHGWQLRSDLPLTDEDGYYHKSNATAFAAEKDGTLAVSIAGSGDQQDLAIDFASASFMPLAYYNDVLPYINEAIKYAKASHSQIEKILITGHSLGGRQQSYWYSTPRGWTNSNVPLSRRKISVNSSRLKPQKQAYLLLLLAPQEYQKGLRLRTVNQFYKVTY